MERVYNAWSDLCLPAQIYPIVMAGVILFDLYKGVYRRGISNIVLTVVGTGLLWVLCAAKLEFVAYGLLTIPVFFTLFLLAIIVFDQSLIAVSHEYAGNSCNQNTCERECDNCY